MKNKLMIFALLALTACGGEGISNSKKPLEPEPIPVGALLSEYKNSKDAVKTKYASKTISVRGYATIAPLMPNGPDDEGILGIKEQGSDGLMNLNCYFRQAEKAEFAEIRGDQMVTLTGTFHDTGSEYSTGLKPCRVSKTF